MLVKLCYIHGFCPRSFFLSTLFRPQDGGVYLFLTMTFLLYCTPRGKGYLYRKRHGSPEEQKTREPQRATSRGSNISCQSLPLKARLGLFPLTPSLRTALVMLLLSLKKALVYVVDTPRTSNPTTFMSNMLYACSVLYKSRLPLVLALNKVKYTHGGPARWYQL